MATGSEPPPQLRLEIPEGVGSTTSFKRSFEQYGFDLEELSPQNGESSSGSSSGRSRSRSKRARSDSNGSSTTLASSSEEVSTNTSGGVPPRLPTPDTEPEPTVESVAERYLRSLEFESNIAPLRDPAAPVLPPLHIDNNELHLQQVSATSPANFSEHLDSALDPIRSSSPLLEEQREEEEPPNFFPEWSPYRPESGSAEVNTMPMPSEPHRADGTWSSYLTDAAVNAPPRIPSPPRLDMDDWVPAAVDEDESMRVDDELVTDDEPPRIPSPRSSTFESDTWDVLATDVFEPIPAHASAAAVFETVDPRTTTLPVNIDSSPFNSELMEEYFSASDEIGTNIDPIIHPRSSSSSVGPLPSLERTDNTHPLVSNWRPSLSSSPAPALPQTSSVTSSSEFDPAQSGVNTSTATTSPTSRFRANVAAPAPAPTHASATFSFRRPSLTTSARPFLDLNLDPGLPGNIDLGGVFDGSGAPGPAPVPNSSAGLSRSSPTTEPLSSASTTGYTPGPFRNTVERMLHSRSASTSTSYLNSNGTRSAFPDPPLLLSSSSHRPRIDAVEPFSANSAARFQRSAWRASDTQAPVDRPREEESSRDSPGQALTAADSPMLPPLRFGDQDEEHSSLLGPNAGATSEPGIMSNNERSNPASATASSGPPPLRPRLYPPPPLSSSSPAHRSPFAGRMPHLESRTSRSSYAPLQITRVDPTPLPTLPTLPSLQSNVVGPRLPQSHHAIADRDRASLERERALLEERRREIQRDTARAREMARYSLDLDLESGQRDYLGLGRRGWFGDVDDDGFMMGDGSRPTPTRSAASRMGSSSIPSSQSQSSAGNAGQSAGRYQPSSREQRDMHDMHDFLSRTARLEGSRVENQMMRRPRRQPFGFGSNSFELDDAAARQERRESMERADGERYYVAAVNESLRRLNSARRSGERDRFNDSSRSRERSPMASSAARPGMPSFRRESSSSSMAEVMRRDRERARERARARMDSPRQRDRERRLSDVLRGVDVDSDEEDEMRGPARERPWNPYSPLFDAEGGESGGVWSTSFRQGSVWRRWQMQRGAGGRRLGDYVRDEDFDTSYESLLALSQTLGEVRPRSTPQHIVEKLERKAYEVYKRDLEGLKDDGGMDVDVEARCPICLDDYEMKDEMTKVDVCSHWLHRSCLEQWLKGATTCPVCRHDLCSTRRGASAATETPAASSGNGFAGALRTASSDLMRRISSRRNSSGPNPTGAASGNDGPSPPAPSRRVALPPLRASSFRMSPNAAQDNRAPRIRALSREYSASNAIASDLHDQQMSMEESLRSLSEATERYRAFRPNVPEPGSGAANSSRSIRPRLFGPRRDPEVPPMQTEPVLSYQGTSASGVFHPLPESVPFGLGSPSPTGITPDSFGVGSSPSVSTGERSSTNAARRGFSSGRDAINAIRELQRDSGPRESSGPLRPSSGFWHRLRGNAETSSESPAQGASPSVHGANTGGQINATEAVRRTSTSEQPTGPRPRPMSLAQERLQSHLFQDGVDPASQDSSHSANTAPYVRRPGPLLTNRQLEHPASLSQPRLELPQSLSAPHFSYDGLPHWESTFSSPLPSPGSLVPGPGETSASDHAETQNPPSQPSQYRGWHVNWSPSP